MNNVGKCVFFQNKKYVTDFLVIVLPRLDGATGLVHLNEYVSAVYSGWHFYFVELHKQQQM